MKTYELIVERLQPSCGGKDPKEVKMTTVTTDDPVVYVRQIEQNGELEVTTTESGEIVISLDQGMKHIKYSFTEE